MDQDIKKTSIPQLVLEKALLEELEPRELEKWTSHPDFTLELEKLKKSNEEILKQYPYEFFAKEVENRVQRIEAKEEAEKKDRPSFFRRLILNPIPTLAVLVTALFLGILAPQISFVDNETGIEIANLDDGIRLKGAEPKISVYLERSNEVINLNSGDQVRSFDSVQIGYQSAGKTYGCIYSVDGRGSITLHFPESFNGSTLLDQGGEILLPYAYQLDDAPEFETFYFVSANQYFDIREMLNGIKETLTPGEQPNKILPDIQDEVVVSTFHLNK
jgi:hypothetical protein